MKKIITLKEDAVHSLPSFSFQCVAEESLNIKFELLEDRKMD